MLRGSSRGAVQRRS